MTRLRRQSASRTGSESSRVTVAAAVDRLLVDSELAHATGQVGSADTQLDRGLADVATVLLQHLQNVVALGLVAKRLERRRRSLRLDGLFGRHELFRQVQKRNALA